MPRCTRRWRTTPSEAGLPAQSRLRTRVPKRFDPSFRTRCLLTWVPAPLLMPTKSPSTRLLPTESPASSVVPVAPCFGSSHLVWLPIRFFVWQFLTRSCSVLCAQEAYKVLDVPTSASAEEIVAVSPLSCPSRDATFAHGCTRYLLLQKYDHLFHATDRKNGGNLYLQSKVPLSRHVDRPFVNSCPLFGLSFYALRSIVECISFLL